MIVLLTSTWPVSKTTEVRDTFVKVAKTPPPPYMKSLGNYQVISGSGKDYKSYNIIEMDDEHMAEGITEILKRNLSFNSIEGFGWSLEILMPLRAALGLALRAVIGLE